MKLGKYEFHRPAAASLRAQATLLRRLLRFCMWSIVFLCTLLFVVGVSTSIIVRTDWFHRWAAQKLTAVISDELEAKLEFSSIRFNIFSGIELDSVRLSTRGDTVLNASSLHLYYELEPLLMKSIVISSVELNDATIRLLRSKQDSSWNVDHIVKATPPNPNKKPFDWTIFIRNIELNRSSLCVYDSLSFEPIVNRIQFVRTNLDSLNLKMSASMNIADKEFALSIDEMRFHERHTGFTVDTLRAAVQLDSTRIDILSVHMISPRSNFLLHGRIDSVNVFAPGADIETRPLALTIEESRLHSNDLNVFLPPDFSLNDEFLVHSDIGGNITKMHFAVDQLKVRQTDLHGHLTIENVANSRPFVYIVDLRHSQANISDIQSALPTLALSDIQWLNHLRFGDTHVYGVKDSIDAMLDLNGDFGGVTGHAMLVFRGPLQYDAQLTLNQFDVYPITNNQASASHLNGTINVHGHGTNLQELVAAAQLNLAQSSFGGRDFRSLAVNVNADNGKVLIDSLLLRLPRAIIDSAMLEDERYASLRGRVQFDFANIDMPVYSAHLKLNDIPMASLLNDQSLPLALTTKLDIEAKGFHPDSLEGKLTTDVEDFIMPDGALFPFTLNASIERSDAVHRKIHVQSNIIDADIDGRFRIGNAWSVFLVHLGLMDTYVRKQYNRVQSDTSSMPVMPPYTLNQDTLDLHYHVSMRGMAAIAPFIHGMRLDAKADVRGSISGTPQRFQFVVDSGQVQRFNLLIDKNVVYAQPMWMSMRVQSEDMTSSPRIQEADIKLRCDSIIRVNSIRFVRPRADIAIRDQHARFDMGTRIENHIPLRAVGTMDGVAHRFDVTLDTLVAGWTRTLTFRSAQSAHVTMSPLGVDIHGILMQLNNGRDMIGLDGRFNSTRFDSLRISFRSLDLATVNKLPELADMNVIHMAKGMVDTMYTFLHGPFTRPQISTTGNISNLQYNDVLVGTQRFAAQYDGRTIRGSASITPPKNDSIQTLLVNIHSLPMDIALNPVMMELRDHETVGISIQAKGLSMAAVSPFVPGITGLSGNGDAQLTISGMTPDNIDYTGAVNYSNAHFLVPATNIRYQSSGHISLKNTTVTMDSLRVGNEETDNSGGQAVVGGTMRINGFSIRDLDLWVEIPKRQKLLVMSEATKEANDFMYGNTVISTQDNDRQHTLRRMQFHGTPDYPELDGFVMIENSFVKFPPTINRTTKTSTFEYAKTGERYVRTTHIVHDNSADTAVGGLPPEEPPAILQRQRLGKSFTDILRTQLDVKINQFMTVQMDFGFNDQLVAVVKQRDPANSMRFIRLGSDSTSLTSDLVVDNSSTYKFYGNFSAGGTMNIDGPIDNPRLNLVATLNSSRVINDKKSNYKVILRISGTKKKPELDMDYEIDGEAHPGAVVKNEIVTNSILLTLFGYTQAEINGNTGQASTSTINSIRSSTLGVVLNRVLQGEIVKGISVKNVNIDFNGGVVDFSQARVQITADIYGANVTLGGTVADPTVTFEIPLTDWLATQYTRATTPGVSVTRQTKQWEFKVVIKP